MGAALRRNPLIALGLLLPGAGLARAGEGTAYVLLEGSTITDTCRDGDRIPIVRALAGGFTLTPEPPVAGAPHYRVSDLDARSPGGPYVAIGSGRFSSIISTPPFRQAMELDLAIDGVQGVVLASAPEPARAPWPAIDAQLAEDGTRDPAHRYTVHLIAAPVPKAWTRYALAEGSTFTDAGGAAPPIPIEGTFLLGEIDSGPNPIVTSIVRQLYARPIAAPRAYRITGIGVYHQGGEVAIRQDVAFRLRVNDLEGLGFAGGADPVPVPLPALTFDARQVDPPAPDRASSIHIVARPDTLPDPLFRRGDANFDGRRDIGDAIVTLAHLFSQGPAPCQDAMDTNDDGVLDLADPIALLLYLFAQGPPPDPPLAACGGDPTRSDALDCSMSPPCPP